MPATDYVKNRRTMIPPQSTQSSYDDPETGEPVSEEEPPLKKRRSPSTSEFVNIQISRDLRRTLKTISTLTGKSMTDLLDEIVSSGVEGYKNLTIADLLNK